MKRAKPNVIQVTLKLDARQFKKELGEITTDLEKFKTIISEIKQKELEIFGIEKKDLNVNQPINLTSETLS